ncbi:MAG: thiamine diphosphokinase [Eubacterium sp.]|nr:thiamine diphosphokinase [Eubacterium sp.]
MNNILIITGGHIDLEFAGEYIKDKRFERIIAADAGLACCRELDIMPTDILGDFDSLKNLEVLEYYKDQGVPVRTFPVRKDYTDTHLALSYAADLKPEMVTILGATGTRYDHALANIGLLSRMEGKGILCKIIDRHNEMEMLTGPGKREFKRRDDLPYLSLLAWGGRVTGIDLSGFSYPLTDGTLSCDVSLGISNELIEDMGTVKIRSGCLLIIRSRD